MDAKKKKHNCKYHCARLCETFDNRLLSALTESAGAANNNALIIINNNNDNINNKNNDNSETNSESTSRIEHKLRCAYKFFVISRQLDALHWKKANAKKRKNTNNC